DAAVIAPAFPALGRMVERGILRVTSDPAFHPIEVSERLLSQGAGPCTAVAASDLSSALASGARFVSVGSVCEQDLATIAAAGLASGRRLLWAGSAGLAAAVASALSSLAPTLSGFTKSSAGVLFCIGSDHPVTMAQQHRLLAARRSVLLHPDTAT